MRLSDASPTPKWTLVGAGAVAPDPVAGEAKVGDLVGIRVYKFRLSNQLYLLAYRILDAESLKLLTLGSHENFYRDLKRIE